MTAINTKIAAQLSAASYTSIWKYQNGTLQQNQYIDSIGNVQSLPAGWSVDVANSRETYTPSLLTPFSPTNQVIIFVNDSAQQIVMAFKGTNNVANAQSDLFNNGAQAYLNIEPTASKALLQIQAPTSPYADYQIFTDGHSLGGGMAQTFALANNLNGYGQNSLPVSYGTSAAVAQYLANNSFLETNTAGDVATAYYQKLSQQSGQNPLYLDPNPTVLPDPYLAVENFGATLASYGSISYMVGSLVSEWALAQSHSIYNLINSLQAPSPTNNAGLSSLFNSATPYTANLSNGASFFVNPNGSGGGTIDFYNSAQAQEAKLQYFVNPNGGSDICTVTDPTGAGTLYANNQILNYAAQDIMHLSFTSTNDVKVDVTTTPSASKPSVSETLDFTSGGISADVNGSSLFVGAPALSASLDAFGDMTFISGSTALFVPTASGKDATLTSGSNTLSVNTATLNSVTPESNGTVSLGLTSPAAGGTAKALWNEATDDVTVNVPGLKGNSATIDLGALASGDKLTSSGSVISVNNSTGQTLECIQTNLDGTLTATLKTSEGTVVNTYSASAQLTSTLMTYSDGRGYAVTAYNSDPHGDWSSQIVGYNTKKQEVGIFTTYADGSTKSVSLDPATGQPTVTTTRDSQGNISQITRSNSTSYDQYVQAIGDTLASQVITNFLIKNNLPASIAATAFVSAAIKSSLAQAGQPLNFTNDFSTSLFDAAGSVVLSQSIASIAKALGIPTDVSQLASGVTSNLVSQALVQDVSLKLGTTLQADVKNILTVLNFENALAGAGAAIIASKLDNLIMPTNIGGAVTGAVATAAALIAFTNPATAFLEVFSIAFGSNFIGTLVGDLIGDIFGSGYRGIPLSITVIGDHNGKFVDGGRYQDNNGQPQLSATIPAENAIISALNTLAASIGGQAQYSSQWAFGIQGSNFYSKPLNQKGYPAFPDAASAAANAIMNILRGTSFTGADAYKLFALQQALASTSNNDQNALNAVISAVNNAGVYEASITQPLAFAAALASGGAVNYAAVNAQLAQAKASNIAIVTQDLGAQALLNGRGDTQGVTLYSTRQNFFGNGEIDKIVHATNGQFGIYQVGSNGQIINKVWLPVNGTSPTIDTTIGGSGIEPYQPVSSSGILIDPDINFSSSQVSACNTSGGYSISPIVAVNLSLSNGQIVSQTEVNSYGSNTYIANSLASTITSTLKQILSLSGGKVIGITNWTVGYGITPYYSGFFSVPDSTNQSRYDTSAFSTLNSAAVNAVMQIARSAQIRGGNPYVMHALQSSTATTVQGLIADLNVAQVYSAYIANPTAYINSIVTSGNIQQLHTLEADLPEVNVLGLNQIHGNDPVILNLQGGAVETTDLANSTMYFDMQNNGKNILTAWDTAGEGLLIYDPNNTNTVTSEVNLVSSLSVLQALNSNHDGVLNVQDAAWSSLKVLVNMTAIGQPLQQELLTLAQLSITSIDLQGVQIINKNQYGNTILDSSTFQMNGQTRQLASVNLLANTAAASTVSLSIGSVASDSAASPSPVMKPTAVAQVSDALPNALYTPSLSNLVASLPPNTLQHDLTVPSGLSIPIDTGIPHGTDNDIANQYVSAAGDLLPPSGIGLATLSNQSAPYAAQLLPLLEPHLT